MLNKKIARSIASCVLIILLLLNCTSCLSVTLSGVGGGEAPTPEGCYIDGKKADILVPETESIRYKRMTEEERMVYNAAYTAMYYGHNEFLLNNVDYQKILDIYGEALTAFIYDFPEFFWLSGYVKANAEYVIGSTEGNVKVSMGLFDYWNDSNLPKAKEIFNNELDSLLNKARNVPDAWERIKFVHDEIVDMTTYDKESYELGEAAGAMKDAYSNSAYGPLVEGIALCGGYAKLFELVMHRLGYECEYITGTADGGPHAWNLLVFDDDYYYVDLTWDDPDLDDGMRLYNYFCVNDAMIEKTHTVDPELKNIKVSATEYNYHVHESLYLTEYNFTSVENIVTSNKSENVISIRFADNKAKREAFEDLVDNYKFFDILQKINKDDYSYIDNDDLNILTFIIG